MSIISKGTSFLGMPSTMAGLNSVRGGNAFTIENIVDSVKMSEPLISFFTTSKAVATTDVILSNGTYYLLGVDFSNFEFKKGYSYTLLIDRYKKRESKGRGRIAGFYHEVNAEETSKRINELDVESVSTKQVFDINPQYYFKKESFPNFMGSKRRNSLSNSLKLGFRMRITDEKGNAVETGFLGFIDMVGTRQFVINKEKGEKIVKDIVSFKN